MSTQMLLADFDRLTERPEAVTQLRRFIMDLAVRGRLVEQSRKDEGASAQPPIPVEGPYKLPSNWAWIRLADAVSHHCGGGTPSKSSPTYWDGDIPWASVKDVGKSKYLDETVDHITDEGLANSSANLVQSGHLIVVTRMGLGKVSINRVTVAINQDLRALEFKSNVSVEFAYIFFLTHGFEGAGLTVKGVKVQDLLDTPFPLPPIAEQRRIVEKVDGLMARCEQLEASLMEIETRGDQLASASLSRLQRSGATGIASSADASFVVGHIARLLARRTHITALRETIRGLALQGRLVPQVPQDGSVEDELARGDATREKIAESDRRADAGQQTLLAPEQRWAVPPSWMWRGLADLVLFIDYRGRTPNKADSGITLVTAKNVRRGFISRTPEEFISESEFDSWMTRGLPGLGDVLFTTEAPMGNASVVRLSERFALAQRVIDLRSYGAIDPEFLTLHLLSPQFQDLLNETATGLTAKGIKAAKLKRLHIAVPPLAEQHRIVVRVDELIAVCDELERGLLAVETGRARLLKAVLQEALAQSDEDVQQLVGAALG